MAPSSRHPGENGDSDSQFRASRRPRLRGSSDESSAPTDPEARRRREDAARRYGTEPSEQPAPDYGTSDSLRRPRMPRRDEPQNDSTAPGAGNASEGSRRARLDADKRRKQEQAAASSREDASGARPDGGARRTRRLRAEAAPSSGTARSASAGSASAASAAAGSASAASASQPPQESEAPRRAERPGEASAGAKSTRSPEGQKRRSAPSRESAYAKQTSDAANNGRDFSSLVRWTTLGTILPGVGLIRAGKRSGWFFLFLFLAIIVVTVVALIVMGPVALAAQLITNPRILLIGAIALALIAIVWALVVIGTFRALGRRMKLAGSQRPLAAVMVASLMVIAAVPFGVASAYGFVQRNTVASVFANTGGNSQTAAQMWADKPRVNMFLIGRDNGDDREGTRPDTMLLASIDTQTGDSTLISVPRNLAFPQFPEGSDLAAQFPSGFDAFGSDESLINAVWTWAEENPDIVDAPEGMEPGLSATMQAVEGSLGLPIDYYAAVDFTGFEDLINAMGGVQIDVERPIPMGGGTNLTTGLKNSVFDWIDPGQQTLDGYKALWYVRSREGSDNYDRMCRQQRMIKTVMGQINPSELAMAYPKLAGSASENIQTDIPQNSIPAFVELAVEVQGKPVKSAQITNEVVQTFNPDYDALREWAAEQVDPSAASQAEQAGGDDTAPTEAGTGDGAGETAAPEETAEPAATSETGSTPETSEPPAGVENADGKCYPKGYDPSAPVAGYNG